MSWWEVILGWSLYLCVSLPLCACVSYAATMLLFHVGQLLGKVLAPLIIRKGKVFVSSQLGSLRAKQIELACLVGLLFSLGGPFCFFVWFFEGFEAYGRLFYFAVVWPVVPGATIALGAMVKSANQRATWERQRYIVNRLDELLSDEALLFEASIKPTLDHVLREASLLVGVLEQGVNTDEDFRGRSPWRLP